MPRLPAQQVDGGRNGRIWLCCYPYAVPYAVSDAVPNAVPFAVPYAVSDAIPDAVPYDVSHGFADQGPNCVANGPPELESDRCPDRQPDWRLHPGSLGRGRRELHCLPAWLYQYHLQRRQLQRLREWYVRHFHSDRVHGLRGWQVPPVVWSGMHLV